jgi:hypothetical protein
MDQISRMPTESGMMRKWIVTLLVLLAFALPSTAGSNKVKGSGTLKDFQPAGTTDKKHKHQQFDFIFDASGTEYTCRSKEGDKLKATDFPVGTDITYEIDKDKGKVKNNSGKKVDCTLVRIEALKGAQESTATPKDAPAPK